jgi:hypothetical protein
MSEQQHHEDDQPPREPPVDQVHYNLRRRNVLRNPEPPALPVATGDRVDARRETVSAAQTPAYATPEANAERETPRPASTPAVPPSSVHDIWRELRSASDIPRVDLTRATSDDTSMPHGFGLPSARTPRTTPADAHSPSSDTSIVAKLLKHAATILPLGARGHGSVPFAKWTTDMIHASYAFPSIAPAVLNATRGDDLPVNATCDQHFALLISASCM